MNWESLLFIVALFGLVLSVRRRKDHKNPDEVSYKPLEATVITIAIYYTAQIAGTLLAIIGPAVAGWNTEKALDWLQVNTLGQFILISLVELATIGLVLGYLKRNRTKPKAIGFIKPRWADIAYALAGVLAYFVLYLVIASIVEKLIPNLNFDQKQQLGFESAYGAQLALVFACLVIIVPFAEEILMRGFLYSGLRNGLKFLPAALITSVLFGLAHLQAGSGAALLWAAALDTFVLSLVLVYLREKTGSLWPPIGLHMLKNGVAFLALFVFHLV